jgi:two-component system NarL family response regulator
VLIAEDHFVMRMGLVAIVNSAPDLMVVAEVAKAEPLIESFDNARPDVALIDQHRVNAGRWSEVSAMAAQTPPARVIILSDHAGDEDIYRALRAGAQGYFSKEVGGTELLEGIRSVHAGKRVLPAEIAFRLANRIPRSELSPREAEILGLISAGCSNKQIASQLSISEGTVRVHASNIFSKLGCNDRAHAVSEAFHRGIIQLH